MKLSQLDKSASMLKRRPSKRFVLAETGEESAWNTTTDNDPAQAPQPPPPQIEIGLPPNGDHVEEIIESPPPNMRSSLTVPQPLKSGMK